MTDDSQSTSTAEDLTVLISAAGRRNYLVTWFRAALDRVGVAGRVLVADADPVAASRAQADGFFMLPGIDDPGYGGALEQLCMREHVGLAISLNDFELSTWSALDSSLLAEGGTRLVAMTPAVQAAVEDKAAMADLLVSAGIRTPRTVLASALIRGTVEPSELGDDLMIKNRFGSASRGARRTTPAALLRDIDRSLAEVTDRHGGTVDDRLGALDALVVQEFVAGVEYGVDCVDDLDGAFAGALARRKIRMRGGETDQAVSVDADRFVDLCSSLAEVTRHPGLIDCDVLESDDGALWLIDVNPRFGGGYPFSHLAGADVPAAYVAWASGRRHDDSWLRPREGVVSAKHIAITEVGDGS